ncbi:hypothetical protein PPTG_14886 [Phytophthora nicotianae INRA-310]|uniref:Uncharacterized protein n=1 Tax=Phytophthora nicotianae (strain INRA-310) TaxID=761204 RepID=W2PT87_PHYN3|nr:hypothetical protein PPTG_14886 [Phytophthora nicotianae INRA-310]ETN04173.1 hypothetical protein PPTG_14886 [Phytophthora nicotianae INRA-310]
MTVTLVHAETFEKILDLIERDKSALIPGTEVVEIALPDVEKMKHEIKMKGTEQLGKRKRAVGQLGRYLQTRFELERYFWTKADKAMSYESFLSVLVTALRKFTHDLAKSFARLDVNSSAFGSISSHDEMIESFKTDKLFDSGENLATTPFATPERQPRQLVVRRRTFGSELDFEKV